jgi:hypothetical protein
MRIRTRVCVVVLIAALLSSLVYAADAGTDTYTLDDLYMKIDIPDDLVTITRDLTEDDQNLQKIGLTSEEVEEYCKEKNIYLDAMSVDTSSGAAQVSYEYAVIMQKNDESQNLFNLGLYDESDIPKDEICEGFKEGIRQYDATFLDYSVLSEKQTKFINFGYSYAAGGSTLYGRLGVTVYNGMCIYVYLLSYNSPISSELTQEQNDIINSIYFTQTLDAPSGTYAAQALAKEKFESIGLPILLGAASVVVLVVVIVVSKKKKKKQQAPIAAAPQPVPADPEACITAVPAQETPPEPTENGRKTAHYCSKCGALLADEAAFCQSCGEPVRTFSSEEIK